MSSKLVIRTFAVALLFLVCHEASASELMVHPRRVVFEAGQRTAQVDVINSGTTPVTYRVTMVRKRMNETGDFLQVEDDGITGELFADELIRYSPRQVTLQPGVAQAVRIQLRKPADLPAGEYRSHILFEALPSAADAMPVQDAAPVGNGITINLRAIYSISIPLIVRHGDLAAEAAISELSIESGDGPAYARMRLDRAGSQSVYGDLTVYFRPASGPERVVGSASGVAVYVPNAVRRVRMPLKESAGSLRNGTFRVVYTEKADAGGAVLATHVIPAP